MEKQKRLPVNALWRIRHSQGLELKQVAKLLGQKSTDSLSRYENGNSEPNLKTTLKLMLIYNSSPKEMFPDLYDCCRREVEENIKRYTVWLTVKDREKLIENISFCTFEKMFNRSNLTDNDKTIIRKHLTNLANKLAYL